MKRCGAQNVIIARSHGKNKKVQSLWATTRLPKASWPRKERSGKWFLDPSSQNGPFGDPRRRQDHGLGARGLIAAVEAQNLGETFPSLAPSKTGVGIPSVRCQNQVSPRRWYHENIWGWAPWARGATRSPLRISLPHLQTKARRRG